MIERKRTDELELSGPKFKKKIVNKYRGTLFLLVVRRRKLKAIIKSLRTCSMNKNGFVYLMPGEKWPPN